MATATEPVNALSGVTRSFDSLAAATLHPCLDQEAGLTLSDQIGRYTLATPLDDDHD